MSGCNLCIASCCFRLWRYNLCIYRMLIVYLLRVPTRLARKSFPVYADCTLCIFLFLRSPHTWFSGMRGTLMRCKRCVNFPFQNKNTIQRCALFFTEFDARFAIPALVRFVPLRLPIAFLVFHDSTSVTQLLWCKLFLNGFPIYMFTASHFQ